MVIHCKKMKWGRDFGRKVTGRQIEGLLKTDPSLGHMTHPTYSDYLDGYLADTSTLMLVLRGTGNKTKTKQWHHRKNYREVTVM